MFKKGFTCGAMDLLHPGHLLMLEDCKKYCKILIVGLHIDPSIERPEKHKPVETVEERAVRLIACKYVDAVIKYSTEEQLYKILQKLNPDVRFLGEDHQGKPFTGDDLPIPIIYNPRNHNYSSTNLIDRIKNEI